MFLLPFEPWLCLLLSIALSLLLLWRYEDDFRHRYLLLTHTTDGWTFESDHRATCVSGALVRAGYRSAWLVILVIQSDDTVLHRVAIWQDQVSSRQFSYLHQQLAFAAEPATARSLLRWLEDCIGLQPARFHRQNSAATKTLRKQTRSHSENTLD